MTPTDKFYVTYINLPLGNVGEAHMRIRWFKPQDEPKLIALGQAEDMGTLSGFHTTLVAETSDEHIAGFCRVRVFNEQAYVNPLVTAPEFRCMGVGRELMRVASEIWGELRFVARGYAVPFYRSIGSVDVPWDAICAEVASDCDGCTLFATCHPQPMSYNAKTVLQEA